MAIISMSDNDPSKKAEKKWVAKATINRIIEIKEKQQEDALDAQQEIYVTKLTTMDKELKRQRQISNVFLFLSVASTLTLLWWVLHG